MHKYAFSVSLSTAILGAVHIHDLIFLVVVVFVVVYRSLLLNWDLLILLSH